MGTKAAPITGHPTSGWSDSSLQLNKTNPAKAKAPSYWEYSQSRGTMTRVAPDGTRELIGTGYSGLGSALDDPAAQDEHFRGPIPRGSWIIGRQQNHPMPGGHSLTAAMRLTPAPGNATDRTDFWIHGDTAAHDHAASKGCIVLPRSVRDAMARSGDSRLEVVYP